MDQLKEEWSLPSSITDPCVNSPLSEPSEPRPLSLRTIGVQD